MMGGSRGATLFAVVTVGLAGTGCAPTGGENEYYQDYLMAEAEIGTMGAQLDSTLIRIRDLENAVVAAEQELAGAETSIIETQLAITRDPGSAEFHALQAREGVARARAALDAVAP